jgi:CRISPR-associated protein Cmr2
VVPAGESGKLKLLYVSPNFQRENNFDYQKAMKTLIDSIDDLLTIYGFSAKRTSGWGTARIERWGAWKNGEYIEEDDKDQFFVKLNPWLTKGEGTK